MLKLKSTSLYFQWWENDCSTNEHFPKIIIVRNTTGPPDKLQWHRPLLLEAHAGAKISRITKTGNACRDRHLQSSARTQPLTSYSSNSRSWSTKLLLLILGHSPCTKNWWHWEPTSHHCVDLKNELQLFFLKIHHSWACSQKIKSWLYLILEFSKMLHKKPHVLFHKSHLCRDNGKIWSAAWRWGVDPRPIQLLLVTTSNMQQAHR